VNEYFMSDHRFISLPMLRWNFGGLLTHVVPTWLAMFGVHSLIVPVMWLWRQRYLTTCTYAVLYTVFQCGFVGGFGWLHHTFNLPLGSSFIILCEQVRMAMKQHSFFRETVRLGSAAHASAHSSEDEDVAPIDKRLFDNFNDQLRQFYTFHFVPTLIYRNSYPRSRKIRWKFVAMCAIEVAGCIFYTYVIFAAFCVPEFHKTAKDPGDLVALSLSIFNSMLPSIAVYMLAFFGILHCWMNMWAELTRFADRQFYQDWWNSTSFLVYYRKWNLVVGDFLFNYIYNDCMRIGLGKNFAMLLTFALSALVHEYIISLALGFWYPVLFFMFAGCGVLFIYLTEIAKGAPMWNVFFWAMLITGNGMLMVLYSREYFARESMYRHAYDASSWIPYSWQPFLSHNASEFRSGVK